MGGTVVVEYFNHYDWRIAVKSLSRAAEQEYGHQQGYSGQINAMDHFNLHQPSVQLLTEAAVRNYIDSRIYHLTKGIGEVIRLGLTGYSIAKAVILEHPFDIPLSTNTFARLRTSGLLVNATTNKIVSSGTFESLKADAQRLLLAERFETDYYLLTKNGAKQYLATGQGKFVKSTSRVSDSTTLVLPHYDFVAYGVAFS